MEFPELKNALGSFLHQDYDHDSGTVAECVFNAIKHSNLDKLRDELRRLDSCDDSTVERVLNDHDVYLWDTTTPHEFLCTLKTLAELFRESPYADSSDS